MASLSDFMVIEQTILKSCFESRDFISELEVRGWDRYFTIQGKNLFSYISDLNKQNKLTYQLLINVLPLKIKQTSYFTAFLVIEGIPDPFSLENQLIKEYQLRKQYEYMKDLERYIKNGELEPRFTLGDDILALRSIKSFNDALKETQTEKITIKTGSFIDRKFPEGLAFSQMILVSGDPEAGKTMLTFEICERIAESEPVLIMPFEFGYQNYVQRMYKLLSEKQKENIKLFSESSNLHSVKNAILQGIRNGIRVFAIDSQMMLRVEKDAIMEELESLKFTILGNLAVEHKILIFLIIQTSKTDLFTPSGSKKGAHMANIMFRLKAQKGRTSDPMLVRRRFEIIKNKQSSASGYLNVVLDKRTFRYHLEEKQDGEFKTTDDIKEEYAQEARLKYERFKK